MDNYRYITGYHGTPSDRAENIMQEGFWLSSRDNEWLGSGIYFYKYFADAANWHCKKDGNPADAVIHAIIAVPENAYIDFETERGREIFKKTFEFIKKRDYRKDITDGLTDAETRKLAREKFQCKVMNYIWKKYPRFSVFSGKFAFDAVEDLDALFDYRDARRELCVRGNENIIIKYIIKVPDKMFEHVEG